MKTTIIDAGLEDWQLLRTIRLQSLQEVPAAYASTYERELAFTDLDWQERLATARTYLAVDAAGAAVGTATALWLRNGEMALVGMYVAPEHRGTGCAQALIEAVVELTRRRHGLRVTLQVMDGNDRAARCYERFGFTQTGRQRTSERDAGAPEIEYAYPLADAPEDVGNRG